jgi:hypothetical protein
MGDMQRLAHRQVAGFDVYHHIMAANWPVFFALLAAAFVAFNFAFGFLYLAVPGSLANAQPGSIADVFFFSVRWPRKAIATSTPRPSMRICWSQARSCAA